MTGDEYLWSAKNRETLLRGNLRDFYFPSLLAYLHRRRSTGILTISRDKIEKHVFIRNGTPCGARSNLKTERMGEMLVSQGVITPQQLERVLDAQKKKKTRFAVSLIEEGIISRHNLFIQSRRLFLSILYSLFGLSEGAYRFEEIDISQDIYCFKVTFTNLMIFGIRQIWDPPALHSMIGEMDQVPVKTGQFSDIPQKHFTEQEHRVTQAIDSHRTILEVIDASGVEQLTALKVLLIMLHLEQIQLTASHEKKGDDPLLDVETSEEAALGFQKYQSCDPKSESAVAGDDFLLPPEGVGVSSPFLEPQAEASGDHLGPFPWIEIARTGQKKESAAGSLEVEESMLEKTGDSGSQLTPPTKEVVEDEASVSIWDHKDAQEKLEKPESETEVSKQTAPDLPVEAGAALEETEERIESSPFPEKVEPEEDHAEEDMALDTAEPVQDKSPRKKPAPRKKAGNLYLVALVLTAAFGLFFMTPWSSNVKDRLYSSLHHTDSRPLPVSETVTEEPSPPPLAMEEGEKKGMEVALSESTVPMETSEPLAPEIKDPVRMDEELPKPETERTIPRLSEEGSVEESLPEIDEAPDKPLVISTMTPSQPEETAPPLLETDATPAAFARVLGIHHEKEKDYLRVIINLDKPVIYKKYELADKKMVFLSLADTRLSPNLTKAPISVYGHRLKRIRTGQYKPDKARVVLDFEKMSKISLFSLEDPFRIVLVISDN